MTIADEQPQDELEDPAALAYAFEQLMQPPMRKTLSDIQVEKTGRGVVLWIRFREGDGHQVRITRAWAMVLKQRLTAVLG